MVYLYFICIMHCKALLQDSQVAFPTLRIPNAHLELLESPVSLGSYVAPLITKA